MSSQGQSQNASGEGTTNSVQPANQTQQQQQIMQQSQGSPYWNPFNQMINFGPNTMYGWPMMNMISYQLAMQQIQSQNFIRPPNSMMYPSITNNLIGNSVPIANSLTSSSTVSNQASATLTNHLSQSSPAATEIRTNETTDTPTQTASIFISSAPNLDVTQDPPTTSKSPEMKLRPTFTDEPRSTSNVLSNGKDGPVITPELEQTLKDKPNLQDEVSSPMREKLRKRETQKLHSSKVKGGKKTTVSPYDRPMFSCHKSNCNRKFRVFEHLKRHLSWHNKEENYRCRFCHEGFALKFQMVSHLKSHDTTKASSKRRDRRTYDCDFCEKKYPLKSRLEKHIEVHMERDEPNDEVDDVLFEEKTIEKRIEKYQFDLRPNFGCRIPGCSKLYAEMREFDAHFKLEHNIDKCPYVCTKQLCGRTFTQKGKLTRHEKTHEKKLLPCPKCYRYYSRRDALRKHLRRDH